VGAMVVSIPLSVIIRWVLSDASSGCWHLNVASVDTPEGNQIVFELCPGAFPREVLSWCFYSGSSVTGAADSAATCEQSIIGRDHVGGYEKEQGRKIWQQNLEMISSQFS
ncbi:MAG: hypothetical protein JXB35_13575, partial [Anaerolineae bacterium]|nr:hypothetical protein [Anaerolineae bacterium]